MKIITQSQYSFNNKTYFNNNFYKNPIHNNKVSFKSHYLDDDLANKRQKLDELSRSISNTDDKISQEEAQYKNESQSLDNNLKAKKRLNKELTKKTEDLTIIQEQKTAQINSLTEKGKALEQDIQAKALEVSELNMRQEQLLLELQQEPQKAKQKRLQKINEITTKADETLKKDIEGVLSSIKNKFIKDVITPTILQNKGDTVNVPSGILIESESDDVSKKIFEWLVKRTDSNYAIINTTDFKNKSNLLDEMSQIAKISKKEFESSHRRTFTFIENFESCGIRTPENKKIIGALKTFLDSCSKDFYNTIVISTNDSSKLDSIVTGPHRFQVKAKLDKSFLQDANLGYNSILKELSEIISSGKEIKNLSISSFIRNLIKTFRKLT